MRVAVAQIDTTVGDIRGNLGRCRTAVAEAQALGAGITLLPELALTGYPPEDLLLKDHFVDENRDALEELAAACGNAVLVGFVDRVGDELFNAAALLGNNRVLQIHHKRRLPNYGVFDERRYFTPGAEQGYTELGGVLMAVTVCEDVWVPEPVSEAAAAGATVLLNISASPFHAGKGAEREAMLAERARANGLWVVYCNLVGGQDELVFDGRSCVISPEGRIVARGAAFNEDLLVADVSAGAKLGASADLAPVVTGPEEVYRAITLGLRDYVSKNGFTDVVIGLSGGIDSALTATLAADALGPERVHGVIMPSRYSSAGSVDDSRALAEALGIEAREIGIEPAFSGMLASLEVSFAGHAADVTEENLQARVRGALLMALSNKFGWLVLATGNKSELSVGYSTLYGDMVGGFAPLKDVFKTRVYELALWRNASSSEPIIPASIIGKAPSAELRPGQTDQDSLPPYDVLDAILARYVELDLSAEEIVADGYERTLVDEVIRMTDRAEYKRRQGPLGVKTTPKAFGRDRRMPVTNRYGG